VAYRFPTSSDYFSADLGAGNEKTGYPTFIMCWYKAVTAWPTSQITSLCGFSRYNNSVNSSISLRTSTSATGRLGVSSYTEAGSGLNLYTTFASVGVDAWHPVIGERNAQSGSNAHIITSTGGNNSSIADNAAANSLRYITVGRGADGLNNMGANHRIAAVAIGFFDITNGGVASISNLVSGTSPLSEFSGRSDYWYYKFETESTTQSDVSGNGGPDLVAQGSPVWVDDYPTLTGDTSVRYIPSVQPLYYGATLLANKTGIEYKVTNGHTNLTGTTIGFGTDGTTDASGNFILPASDNLDAEFNTPALNDPVTLHLYWEEGTDPVVDRSLIVKTTLVEDT